MYRLKETSENFEMVEGPMAGIKFNRGSLYPAIPAEYADHFDKIPEDEPATVASSGNKAQKKEVK